MFFVRVSAANKMRYYNAIPPLMDGEYDIIFSAMLRDLPRLKHRIVSANSQLSKTWLKQLMSRLPQHRTTTVVQSFLYVLITQQGHLSMKWLLATGNLTAGTYEKYLQLLPLLSILGSSFSVSARGAPCQNVDVFNDICRQLGQRLTLLPN